MKRRFSLPCGTLFGAQLRIHPLLLLMIPLAVWLDMLPYFLMVFFLVLVHELSHVLVANALGVQVMEIELAPFGGVARMASDLESMPMQEMVIALAGPLSNVLWVLLAVFLDRYVYIEPALLSSFLSCNLLLAGFNLLPALPLDGGRVLRAALSLVCGLERATKWTARAGCILGMLIVLLGVYQATQGTINVTYFLCGTMLVMMAYREGQQATSLYLRDITSRQASLYKDGALRVRHIAVHRDTTVASVARRFHPRSYHRIVLLGDQFQEIGEVSEGQIVYALLNQQTNHSMGEIADQSKRLS